MLLSCCRMTAESCWQSRRSTAYWRRFKSSSTSSPNWQTTFSWMLASPSPSLRYTLPPLTAVPALHPVTNGQEFGFGNTVFWFQDNRVHIGPKMEIRVVTLGLDGAGKTTILFKLKQDEFMQPIPTIGKSLYSVISLHTRHSSSVFF